MGFLFSPRNRMDTDMNSKNNCLLRAGSSPVERTPSGLRPIDSRTTQAFHQLRLHAEELALELAARLRVLGKSLAATCPGKGDADGKRTGAPAAYAKIRRQLDGFFGSLAGSEFAGNRHFLVIRDYLQATLPPEPNGCGAADPCRIELVEAVVCFLSESNCENDGLSERPMVSFS
jgi:hypothetical protein